jgi:hypothetical protein
MVSSSISISEAPLSETNDTKSIEKLNPDHQPNQISTPPSISETSLCTRNACALAVLAGWITSIVCIVIGAHMIASPSPLVPFFKGKYVGISNRGYCFASGLAGDGELNMKGHQMYVISKGVQFLITLSLNAVATLLLDSMSYIHSITLRWALIRENRLQKNSNLRILSSARSYFPNKWYMNTISWLSLAISYGSSSSFITDVDIQALCRLKAGTEQDVDFTALNEGPQDGLDFNGLAMVGLGIGILLQAFVSTCSLCKGGLVGTWSSNPLTTVKVYSGMRSCEDRFLGSLNDSKTSPQVCVSTSPVSDTPHVECNTDSPISACPSSPAKSQSLSSSASDSQEISNSFPQQRQPSMLSMLPNACRVRYIVWAFFGTFAIWSVVIVILDAKSDRFGTDYLSGILDWWKRFGLADFGFIDNIHTRYHKDLVGLCIQIIVQSFISFGLHCAELVINVSRDEANWRKAATVGISMEDSISAKTLIRSWPTMAFAAFKSVVQSVFGFAFTVNDAVDIGMLPLVTIAGLLLSLAVFTEYLVRRRPKGYQPATYGDIQRIAYFVDEWDHKVLFWGDKGEIGNGVRKAGTAGHRLSDIRPDTPYVGLDMDRNTS